MLDPLSEKFPPSVAFEAAAVLQKMTITVLHTSREGNYNYFNSYPEKLDATGHYHCMLNLLFSEHLNVLNSLPISKYHR